MSSLIYFALIGIAAGWLGGRIMKGSGFGLIGNLVVGVVGAMLGGWALGALGIYTSGLIGSIISATVGAVLLLFIVSLIKK
ncbi:MAG: GlsB/YeaQ/YmgE family stress response membrane protein [Bacteroidota bacterium]